MVLSDYGKGVLIPLFAKKYRLARAKGVPVVVDPKGTDWRKYKGSDHCHPQPERIVRRELNWAWMTIRPSNWRPSASSRLVALTGGLRTRSQDGMSLMVGCEPAVHLRLPGSVRDCSGAGRHLAADLGGVAGVGCIGGRKGHASPIAAGIWSSARSEPPWHTAMKSLQRCITAISGPARPKLPGSRRRSTLYRIGAKKAKGRIDQWLFRFAASRPRLPAGPSEIGRDLRSVVG